jgi:hypothetical protein
MFHLGLQFSRKPGAGTNQYAASSSLRSGIQDMPTTSPLFFYENVPEKAWHGEAESDSGRARESCI